MVMNSRDFDWYINVLCRVSHGLIINVGCGMLDRLVVNVSLCMLNWLIFSFFCIVSVSWLWLVVMWAGIVMISNVSCSWDHRHMVVNMVLIMVTVVYEFDIMVRDLMRDDFMMNGVDIMVFNEMDIMVFNGMDIMVFNGMDNMVFNGMDVVVNGVDVVMLNLIMLMVEWMGIMMNVIVDIMMIGFIVMTIVNMVI